ncbi:hypothetical protein VCHA53O466_40253 [Vibrio chagasii]|nr:hypothetical protein VCHA53O466_40253 [Vibrio chagasii]
MSEYNKQEEVSVEPDSQVNAQSTDDLQTDIDTEQEVHSESQESESVVDADFKDEPEQHDVFESGDVGSYEAPKQKSGFYNEFKSRFYDEETNSFRYRTSSCSLDFQFDLSDLKTRSGIIAVTKETMSFFTVGACGMAVGAAICTSAVLMAITVVLTAAVVGCISLAVFGAMDLIKWIKGFGS